MFAFQYWHIQNYSFKQHKNAVLFEIETLGSLFVQMQRFAKRNCNSTLLGGGAHWIDCGDRRSTEPLFMAKLSRQTNWISRRKIQTTLKKKQHTFAAELVKRMIQRRIIIATRRKPFALSSIVFVCSAMQSLRSAPFILRCLG